MGLMKASHECFGGRVYPDSVVWSYVVFRETRFWYLVLWGGEVKGRFRKSDVPKNQSLVACYLLGISSIARLCEQSQLH